LGGDYLSKETILPSLYNNNPFMTSTKNWVFDPLPLYTSVHMSQIPLPSCGRPHAVDMKYTSLT